MFTGILQSARCWVAPERGDAFFGGSDPSDGRQASPEVGLVGTMTLQVLASEKSSAFARDAKMMLK